MADDAGLTLRVPPHSVEAEQSVIGAALWDNAVVDAVGDLLHADDFYRHDHRLIWGAIEGLVMASKPADVITVFERLRSDPRARNEEITLADLNAMAQSVPGPANARRYAEIVRERSLRRRLIGIGMEIERAAWDHGEAQAPVQDVADRAVLELLALQAGAQQTEPVPIATAVAAFLDDLTARYEGKVTTFPTGLADVDRLTGGGGRRGELWVIGARPSMGKTAITLQLCRYTGRKHQVLLLSQEDSLLSASGRFVAAEGAVNLADLRNPRAAPDSMWAGVTEAVENLAPLNIAMDEETGLGLADVRRKAQQVRRRCGALDLIVIDYLQLMDGDEGENRNQTIGAIANGLKRLAKQLGCWIVLLSQLNRKADDRPGPPQMSDLRDSGDIEGAADLIGLLYREHMRKPTPENKHWAQLHVCKQKNGATDTLNLYFDGALQRFGNWEGPAPFRHGKGGSDGA